MKIKDVISFISKHVPFKFYANDFPRNDNGNCGFVRIDGGDAPDIYVVGLKSPSVQIVIRHEDGNKAEEIAGEIWSLFHGKEHYRIGSTKVYFSSCDQSEPIYIGTDKNHRTIYSINVTCKISD
jgi:Bacteriophage minor capsid protein